MKHIIDTLHAVKKELKYYYDIHCKKETRLIERIDESIRDAWEMDERKIAADKKRIEEREAKEIEQYGITMTEFKKHLDKMSCFKESSPEHKEAKRICDEAEQRGKEWREKQNGKA